MGVRMWKKKCVWCSQETERARASNGICTEQRAEELGNSQRGLIQNQSLTYGLYLVA